MILLLLSALLLFIPAASWASVKGACVNCHTMHNSQNGVEIYTESAKRGGPGYNLLNTTCIGCHSSTDGSPTKPLGESTIPIVYNTVEPAQMTAGGNFYYVQHNGDNYGHNVISVDQTLSSAPGSSETGVGCGFGGCHASLASIRLGPGYDWFHYPIKGNGCIGCHVPRHHAPDPAPGGVVKEENGCYRFLGRPAWVWDIPPHSSRPGVEGIEDPDWELTVGQADHNEYRDADKPAAPYSPGSANPMGISDFCAGCHRDYHSWDLQNRNRDATGGWLRHPAGDTEIPSGGEYAAYTAYNPQAPVSRPVVSIVSSTVTPGVDRVMCLSCHRVHGSPYPDMLRWNYENMAKETGCYVCHTSKDDHL
ncbi:MAG: cytochrome c3 family protein [Thermodesulfobacteriota bacterium]